MVRNFALVIGINHYEHISKNNHLKCAVRDAEAMRDFLLEVGFLQENILLCTEDLIQEQTGDLIQEKIVISQPVKGIKTNPAATNLKIILQQKIPSGESIDNFLFFFAGHGTINRAHQDCLIPSDGEISIPDSLVTIDFVVDCLRDLHGIKNIILILDMCRGFSPPDRDSGMLGAETESLTKQKGIVTIFACQRNHKSYEIEDAEIRHGAFTYCLLQGLRQHTILKSLDVYLRRELPKLTQKYQQPQTPLIIAEPSYRHDQPLLIRHATEADITSLLRQAEITHLKARSIPELENAKKKWRELIRLSNNSEIREQALDYIDNIDDRIKEKQRINNQFAPKVEEPPTRVVVPIPVVQPAKSVEEVKPKLPSYSFSVITLDGKGQKVGEERGEAKYFREELGNGVTLDMVQIPGGEFWMGTSDQEAEEYVKNAIALGYEEKDARRWVSWEKPRHRVQVPDFLMGKFLVTQGQWEQVAKMKKIKTDLKAEPAHFKGSKDLPVDSVNWHEAVEFCARLSKHTSHAYRLPSEAEWEYSCRAKTETAFHLGATITPEYVNYDGNYPYAQAAKGEYRGKTTTVGSFPPNGFGLYDMHGNLWEWCEDDFHDSYKNAPDDGSAWIDNDNYSQDKNLVKMLRGGSWDLNARFCRSGSRIWSLADTHNNYCGFRVACRSFLPRTR